MENAVDTQRSKYPQDEVDWEGLRAQSIQPHGFGQERVRIWPKLLHVQDVVLRDPHSATDASVSPQTREERTEPQESNSSEVVTPHADERQISLDTDRSFVLYPETANREKLQTGLNRLIVSLFRRRPRLHYFQGYHDIVSVLFLTLPEELHFPVTEKMSLHRVRDSMGTTLEPVVGLLRILKRILHLADEKFAATLESAAPLPYYALSNLLTLFSHDVPTLPLIQHIFDYLLSRPPIAVVYLAAALTLTRREEVRILEDEGEEGMMHSLLTSLPDLYEEGDEDTPPKEESPDEVATTSATVKAESAEVPLPADSGGANIAESPTPTNQDDLDCLPAHETASTQPTADDTPLDDPVPSPTGDDDAPSGSVHVDKPHPTESSDTAVADSATEPHDQHSPLPDTKPKSEPTEPPLSEKAPPTRTASPEPLDPIRPHRPRVSLTALLAHADALYAQYPPTHPGVALSSIMGPQSVMLTWSERRADLPSDDDAERMVLRPDLVVLPHVEPEDDDIASEGESLRSPGRARNKEKEKERERKRRRLRKPRRLTDIVVQRKTMVAGAVLVLGVAMAVYGFNAGLPGSGGGHHRNGFGREWKKVGRFLGGAFVGAGERVFESIRHGLH
ncbi:rab-GTPase-TBC domain-containing protein [Trametes polyzona]|nr:rab-GTPase-TBC domain-containing protein [Trametes polyzona]